MNKPKVLLRGLDPEVKAELDRFLKQKYGRKYGFLSLTLNQAILECITKHGKEKP